MDEPITEDWLREVGFKWHQIERQNEKQWLLWLGDACNEAGRIDTQDLGIEVSSGFHGDDRWFCWLRCDLASLYGRFIHIRHLRTRQELIAMIVGLTGQDWSPENNIGGCMLRPERAVLRREELQRLDLAILRERRPWRDIEKDDSRGAALPEHMQLAIAAGKAK
jgi:hypothetical protein